MADARFLFLCLGFPCDVGSGAYNAGATLLAAAEHDAHTTAADQADQPSSVRSLPENGSLIPKVTLICSCTSLFVQRLVDTIMLSW